MQLQNAADAAAFGASTLEARSLNFAAYTNRAMVANEVAIGQLVGLLSMVDEFKTSGEYIDVYIAILEAAAAASLLIPVVGEIIEGIVNSIVSALEGISSALTEVSETLLKIMEPIASPAIRGLSIVNQVYSVSQTVYHGATIVLVTTNIFKSLEDNVPGTSFNPLDFFKKDKPGAQLSPMGIVALAGHLPSYWQGYTKRYVTKEKKENEGMGRMAATVRDARDPFSSGGGPIRDKNIYGFDIDYYNRSWEFGFGFDLKLLKFFFGLNSKGGSEIRYKDKGYVWSALDTAVVGAELKILGLPIDLDLPIGGGGYQAAGKSSGSGGDKDDEEGGGSNGLTVLDMVPDLAYYGSPKAYGEAGYPYSRLIPWGTAAVELQENQLKGNPYAGLQPYRDMAKMDDKKSGYSLPFIAPYFLVGVTRAMKDITDKGPQFAGQLDLIKDDNNKIVDRLGVIAKSEVYFSRPEDLSYFARKDKKKEKPNVFSPFWQARLAETNNIDRFLALAVQQHTIWLPGKVKEDIPGLEAIVKALEDLLDTLSNL